MKFFLNKSFLVAVVFCFVANLAQADQYADFLTIVKKFDDTLDSNRPVIIPWDEDQVLIYEQQQQLLENLNELPDVLDILSNQYIYCRSNCLFYSYEEFSCAGFTHCRATFQEWLKGYKNLPEEVVNAFRAKGLIE